jgi:hypothetical protein
MPDNLLFPVVAGLVIGVFSFYLGYDAGRDDGTKDIEAAVETAQTNLFVLHQQQAALSEWVETNWPTEYAAYVMGHDQGFQSGIWSAPYFDGNEP